MMNKILCRNDCEFRKSSRLSCNMFSSLTFFLPYFFNLLNLHNPQFLHVHLKEEIFIRALSIRVSSNQTLLPHIPFSFPFIPSVYTHTVHSLIFTDGKIWHFLASRWNICRAGKIRWTKAWNWDGTRFFVWAELNLPQTLSRLLLPAAALCSVIPKISCKTALQELSA